MGYRMSEAARAVCARWWPGLEVASMSTKAPVSVEGVDDFSRRMAGCQAELIRLYLPTMDRERVPWAERTLREIYRRWPSVQPARVG